MPVVVPELADRCVVINAVSKAYAMTGWRVGWMIAPPDVTAAATNLQSHTTSNVSNVSQAAALAALTGSLDFTTTMRAAFDVRRRRMHELLSAIPGVSASSRRAPSTPSRPSRASSAGRSAVGGRRRPWSWPRCCWRRRRWPSSPGEAFGAPGYARLSYALGEDELVEGLTRLAEVLGG